MRKFILSYKNSQTTWAFSQAYHASFVKFSALFRMFVGTGKVCPAAPRSTISGGPE